ncbi:TPA: hypothetical protein NH808_006393, partial [Pseudomonas aeruginosa]|nr:hypothetical protein [Pseudomonas aeruginosa]
HAVLRAVVPNAGFGQVLDPLLDALNSDLVLGLLLLDLLLSALELHLNLRMSQHLLSLGHRRTQSLQPLQNTAAHPLGLPHADEHALVQSELVTLHQNAALGVCNFFAYPKFIAELILHPGDELVIPDAGFIRSGPRL